MWFCCCQDTEDEVVAKVKAVPLGSEPERGVFRGKTLEAEADSFAQQQRAPGAACGASGDRLVGPPPGAWRPLGAVVPPPSGVGPAAFTIVLRKTAANDRIGLDTVARSHATLGCALRVQRIKEGGLVAEWNRANSAMQVYEGDHICNVNGESSDTESMYRAIAGNAELRMLIRRSWP
mmetsp:Transcript_79816/g.230704  ORF Transcript_79816/g.230704 Transcript_79816/m.230704 type:complete len:178 (-) Transcript_79816:153-686(-)